MGVIHGMHATTVITDDPSESEMRIYRKRNILESHRDEIEWRKEGIRSFLGVVIVLALAFTVGLVTGVVPFAIVFGGMLLAALCVAAIDLYRLMDSKRSYKEAKKEYEDAVAVATMLGEM